MFPRGPDSTRREACCSLADLRTRPLAHCGNLQNDVNVASGPPVGALCDTLRPMDLHMPLPTKTKIRLARSVQRVIMAGRRVFGRGPIVLCRRGGVVWHLDLREGIDFSIFLLGAFEPRMGQAYRTIVPSGATVIDVGANIGAHTLPLADCVSATGRVIAVEPTRYAFERLRQHIDLNPALAPRVIAIQAMLMGSRDAALADAIESSWPLAPTSDTHSGHGGLAKATTGAAVTTLDAVVADQRLTRVDLIKLDVDGYEVEVLRGARNTLARFAPTIIFEHSPYTAVEKGYDPDEIPRILQDAGYVFADLSRRRLNCSGGALPAVERGSSVNLLAVPANGI